LSRVGKRRGISISVNDAARLEAVEARGLACVRGGRLIFRDLDFSVARGDALSLEGPNGAGKSSALRMLAGLLPPVEGTIRFRRGAVETSDAEERGKLVGWFGHADGLKAQLTVRENAEFAAALYGSRGNVLDVLAGVGLLHVADLPALYLSAGQKRRLGLARLLISARPLWLLDEPLAALDRAGKALATELIQAHCVGGGIAIAATHDPIGVAGPKLVLERRG
jgi:heme exporter protein A